jgi:hypothetical protein
VLKPPTTSAPSPRQSIAAETRLVDLQCDDLPFLARS